MSQEREFDPQTIMDSLRKFHDSEPNFPVDPAEQTRRFNLLQTDPSYIKLRVDYEASTGQARLELSHQMNNRRWAIFTNPDPEQLISQAQEIQKQQ